MAIFPRCTFSVDFDGHGMVAGEQASGTIELTNEEAIPRAEALRFEFRSDAWAAYAAGSSKGTKTASILRRPFTIGLREGVLPAGTHRYPFTFDVPASVPPAIKGEQCAIEHSIHLTLDVDWAFDPAAQMAATVRLRPRHAARNPVITRSPPGFHESIVLDVTLDSSVLLLRAPVQGEIALRAGHDAKFDFIEVSYASILHIVFEDGDRRQGAAPSIIRIPADRLREGRTVLFEVPSPGRRFLPSLRNSYIDHQPCLVIRAIIPWHREPSFEIPLEVLPAGSTIDRGDAPTPLVGAERLREVAARLAEAADLHVGRLPVLAEGRIGPVVLRLIDAPHDGDMGVDLEFGYPDLELGIEVAPAGFLAGRRRSRLLPDDLHGYTARARNEDSTTIRLLARILASLGNVVRVRMSDTKLTFHVALAEDGVADVVAIASLAQRRAEAIGIAIAELAFPERLAAARPAWEAAAAEESATLVPSGPALHGLVIRARIVGGEQRSIRATIRTTWSDDPFTPYAAIDLDLDDTPLPPSALERLPERFPNAQTTSARAVSLAALPWPSDPRTLLPFLDTFLAFVLEARGERRSELAYR